MNIGDKIHRVLIESLDGIRSEVKLEDGTRIEGVVSAAIFLDGGEIPRADLTIIAPKISISAKAESISFACPVCQGSVEHNCHDDSI